MRDAIKAGQWPLQCFIVGMFLIGKKSGGSRTIALMASFMRLVMAHLGDSIRAWDLAVARPDDTALKGKNAEVAVTGEEACAFENTIKRCRRR